jgi:MFS family permease
MRTQLSVLRHRDFRRLFLGQAASVVGDRIVVVTLALYVTQRTGSATDLGIVLAAQTAPLVGLLLFGGVWADRLPRHRIIIAADLVRGVLHALTAVLVLAGALTIWELAVIEAGFGAAQAFFQPAYSGLVPQTVPEAEIQEARALTESMANLAFLVGPALGTALVLGLGAGEAFAVDAASFLVSAVLLLEVHPRRRGPERPVEPVLRSLASGWREVRSRAWVWVTIVVFTGSVMCVYAQWYALAPSIMRDDYGATGLFGLLESLVGAGAVVGAVVGLRWRPQRPLRAGMLFTLAWPVNSLLLALGAPLPIVGASAFVHGLGFALLMIWWETALAHHIPPSALSRVSAWDWMGSLALLPVGYALAGPLAGAFGAREVLGAGSVIGLVLVAIGLLPRSVRELPGPPDRVPPAQPSSSRVMSV